MSNKIPDPITREEQYLYAIAKNGGGGGGASSADEVSYDNTASGLNATNVQDAIDEMAQGGGGESNVERLEVTMSGNVVSTVKTAAEIEALYAAGKMIYACTNIGAYALIHFGLFLTPEVTQDGYVLYGYCKGDSADVINIAFTGSSADAPLSATISMG